MGAPVQRTVSDVLQDIVGNVQQIFRAEVKLAKAEAKQKVQAARKPAMTMAVGAVIGFFGLGFLFLAAMYALTIVVAPWAAALIIGVLLAIGGAAFLSAGQASLKRIHPLPEKTVHTVKENVQWTKDLMKSRNTSAGRAGI